MMKGEIRRLLPAAVVAGLLLFAPLGTLEPVRADVSCCMACGDTYGCLVCGDCNGCALQCVNGELIPDCIDCLAN